MISRIARLRAKKGFTIVELVVVISIIGILTAMIIPIVSYDRKPAVARTITKEIYYRAASVLSDAKAASIKLPEGDYIAYYAEVDSNSRIVDKRDSSGNVTEYGTGEMILKSDGSKESRTPFTANMGGLQLKMRQMFEKYVTNESSISTAGHLIVVTDSSYRIITAYWTENYGFAGAERFVEDNVLESGQFCLAYPYGMSAEGKFMYILDSITGMSPVT